MNEAGEKAVALGKSIGVSHVTIGNYLDGQLPKSEHLLKIADHYKLPMDWFFGRSHFMEALMEQGVDAKRKGEVLHIWLKEKREISAGKVMIEIGRLLESGVSPGEILRRVGAEPKVSPSKKPSSKPASELAEHERILDAAENKDPGS
jgi:hypothetical protein